MGENNCLNGMTSSSCSCYEILGIKNESGEKEIKPAYRQLAQKYHPDKNRAPEAKFIFQQINNAYDILSSSQSKSLYDQYLKAGGKECNDQSSPFIKDDEPKDSGDHGGGSKNRECHGWTCWDALFKREYWDKYHDEPCDKSRQDFYDFFRTNYYRYSYSTLFGDKIKIKTEGDFDAFFEEGYFWWCKKTWDEWGEYFEKKWKADGYHTRGPWDKMLEFKSFLRDEYYNLRYTGKIPDTNDEFDDFFKNSYDKWNDEHKDFYRFDDKFNDFDTENFYKDSDGGVAVNLIGNLIAVYIVYKILSNWVDFSL